MALGLPEDFFTVPGQRRRGLPQPRRAIPWWPVVLILAGTLAAGPVGLLATSIAGALVVLRLRVVSADPQVSDLPALPWSRRSQPSVLPGFTRTVGAVEWGLASAFDFDTSLRPRLARVAAVRLADRHGVDIADQPQQAARLLGAEAWRLLDPARPPAGDRTARGPDRAALARVLDAIEWI